MILPDLVLTSRQNHFWTEAGIDSLEECVDKQYFKSYPYPVEYHYNSRGFRDNEWPVDLKESVWCIGDSFTVGVGSTLEHTWVNLLQKKLNRRCINISMDGASNVWISRKAVDILNEIQPKLLIIHWSYFFRDEIENVELTDEDRRLHHVQDISIPSQLEMFAKCLTTIEQQKQSTHIIHSFIPNGPPLYDRNRAEKEWNILKGNSWPNLPVNLLSFNNLPTYIKTELQKFDRYDIFRNFTEYTSTFESILNSVVVIPELEKIDRARDGHHYDILTATNFVEQLATVISALPVY